jgi:hypothetical protein
MDAIFPLKSKKSIKAFNQAASHNNALMRLKIQNALYQQELNRVKAANDSINAALALAQQQVHDAAAALAQQQAREAVTALAQQQARDAAAAALAQRQQQASSLDLIRKHHLEQQLAAQKKAQEAAQAHAQANANKQELIASHNNKKSSKFGKLLSKMNKQH